MKKTPEEILAELEPLFREALDCATLVLSPTLTPDDVDAWDSLANLQLIMLIGRHFNLRFTTREVLAWRCVGDIVATLHTRL